MFGAGLSKRSPRRPRTTCGVSRRSRRESLLAAFGAALDSMTGEARGRQAVRV